MKIREGLRLSLKSLWSFPYNGNTIIFEGKSIFCLLRLLLNLVKSRIFDETPTVMHIEEYFSSTICRKKGTDPYTLYIVTFSRHEISPVWLLFEITTTTLIRFTMFCLVLFMFIYPVNIYVHGTDINCILHSR